jgi:hypothetical protein
MPKVVLIPGIGAHHASSGRLVYESLVLGPLLMEYTRRSEAPCVLIPVHGIVWQPPENLCRRHRLS